MNEMKDGGQAFPIPEAKDGVAPGFGGISIRDYFAAKAMQQLIPMNHLHPQNAEFIAKEAYRFADAMITEREGLAKLVPKNT